MMFGKPHPLCVAKGRENGFQKRLQKFFSDSITCLRSAKNNKDRASGPRRDEYSIVH